MRRAFPSKRGWILIAQALGLAIVLLIGSAGLSPAQANIYTNDFCLYQNHNRNIYTGGDWQCFDAGAEGNIKASLNDQVTSIDNQGIGSVHMCAYDLPDQRGEVLVVYAQSYYRNLTYDPFPGGGNWNDRISSVGYCGG